MKVIVYTTPQCFWCNQLKEWLKQHKIKFEERDVSKDSRAAQEMIEKSGQMGVPVIEIDGKIVVGFDVKALKKLLNI